MKSFLRPVRKYLSLGSIWKTDIISSIRKVTLHLFIGIFENLDTIPVSNVSRLEETDKESSSLDAAMLTRNAFGLKIVLFLLHGSKPRWIRFLVCT
jgi:hypothetical protein